jgi:hypothetical protein
MPNVPSRGAQGSGNQPILPNRAAQSAAIDREQEQFFQQFTAAVYDMQTTTQFQNAMADHSQLLLDASAASDAEPDANKKVEVFDDFYNQSASDIAQKVADPQRRAEFDRKSGAHYGVNVARVQAAQLKGQRQEHLGSLAKTANQAFLSVINDNSPGNLRLQEAEITSAADNAIRTGALLQNVTNWKEKAIQGLYQTVANDLLIRGEFGRLSSMMGYDQNFENYAPEQDELAGMDPESRQRFVRGGLALQAAEDKEIESNHEETVRKAKAKQSDAARAQIFTNLHNGILGPGAVEFIENQVGLERITQLEAVRALADIETARTEFIADSARRAQGDAMLAGHGVDYKDSGQVKSAEAAFERTYGHLITQENQYHALAEFTLESKFVGTRFRQVVKGGLSLGGDDAVAAAVLHAQVNRVLPQASERFEPEELALLADINENFSDRKYSTSDAYTMALASRHETTDQQDAARFLRSNKPGALGNEETFLAIGETLDDIFERAPSGVPNKSLLDLYPGGLPERPLAMQRQIMDNLVAFSLQVGGDPSRLTGGQLSTVARLAMRGFGITTMGDTAPRWMADPVETQMRPGPDGSWQVWDDQMRAELIANLTPWNTRGISKLPGSAEGAQLSISTWVDANAPEVFDAADRAASVTLYTEAYQALLDSQNKPGFVVGLFVDNQAAVGVSSHRDTTLGASPSYSISLLDKDGIPISLESLGASEWVASEDKVPFFREQAEQQAALREAGRLRAVGQLSSDQGAQDAYFESLGVPGADTSQRTPAETEAVLEDRARAYPQGIGP